jgi:NADPH:quinone reductase-like Zn-dependent oxidoreductase
MAQERIPDQMMAVVLESYSGVEALRVEQRPVPKPGKDEVLVKVAASPINPSDLAFLEGKYGFDHQPPITPGGEGSGVVVAVGPGGMGRYFLGKRVACLWHGEGDGVWAEYMVASTKGGVLPLDKSVNLEQGAMSTINPLTATAFIEIAKEGGQKAIVLTAAASSLGQKVNRLAHREGIQVINVIRKLGEAEILRQQGATVILNSSEAGFNEALQDACHQHDAHLAFDAVAGSLTEQLLEALPKDSKVTIYSCLSYESPKVNVDHFVFQNKAIDGFWLGPWISSKNIIQIMRMWRRAQKLISTELRSEIRTRYPFQEAQRAVREYQSQMTGGKILLKPSR